MSVAERPFAQDRQIVLSADKTRRDLRISIGLSVVGAALYLLYVGYGLARPGGSTGGPGVLIDIVVGGAGSIFLLVGLIFVGVNWWLLRQRLAVPRGPTVTSPQTVASSIETHPPESPPSLLRTRIACPNCGSVWPVGAYRTCPKCSVPLP